MHDNHSVNSTSELGRSFTGDGDRRLRPHQHDIKCPRCDSLNTKFCYYNNYNLSQPRHFCKNCRRYWTKGGVLRNVPVGGGVRKTKRYDKSKPKTNNVHKSSHPEHSNSDTSSLTTTTTTAKFELLTEGNNISKEVADNVDMFQWNQHSEIQWIDHTPMYNDHCEDDQGLFGLTGSVDGQSYWSQSQWNDNQL